MDRMGWNQGRSVGKGWLARESCRTNPTRDPTQDLTLAKSVKLLGWICALDFDKKKEEKHQPHSQCLSSYRTRLKLYETNRFNNSALVQRIGLSENNSWSRSWDDT